MFKRIRTLRRTFFTLILPVTAVLTLLFFIIIQWFELTQSYEELRTEIRYMEEKQEQDFIYPMWTVNYERIDELARTLFRNRILSSVNVFDEKNNPVKSYGINSGYSREAMDYLVSINNNFELNLNEYIKTLLSSFFIQRIEPENNSYRILLNHTTSERDVFLGSLYITVTNRSTLENFQTHFRLFLLLVVMIFTLISFSISIAYHLTIQIPLGRIRSFIHDKETMGLFDKILPEVERNNDLAYIQRRFERLWDKQDLILKEQHDSKEYYRDLLNSLPTGLILFDEEGTIIETNFAFQSLSGYTEQELLKMTMESMTPEDYIPVDLVKFRDLKTNGFFKPYDKKIINRQGKEIPVKINGATVIQGDKKKFLISIEDISDIQTIESELKRSYRYLDTASQMAKVGGWELDLKTGQLNWTREVYRIHELEEDFVPDLESFFRFIHMDYQNLIRTAMERARKSSIPFEIEARLVTAQNKEIWVLIKGQPRFEGNSMIAISGTLQDISERKQNEEEFIKLQQELEHKSRLDLIGQLASGVAHDFNNILSGIISSAEILNFRLKDQPDNLKKYTEIIISQAENASMLSSRLLALSRKGSYNKTSVSINHLLKDTVSILKNTLDRKIEIELNMDEESFLNIDYSSIQNAIMNICINSSHAMPDGGRLVLEKSREANVSGEHFEKILIKDTGTGIDGDCIGHIFDPFFTTKEEGKGTGLGLSAVKRAVEDHQGSISVTSVEGEGTTMILMFPAEDNPMQEQKENKNVVFGKGSILLVDDEAINRMTGKEIIQSLGYDVTLAENGQQAVDIYKENINHIDLIILDMVMPVMDGYEAYEKLTEIDPQVKILILTGFADHAKLKHLKERGVEGILKKPFQIPQLSQRLSQLFHK